MDAEAVAIGIALLVGVVAVVWIAIDAVATLAYMVRRRYLATFLVEHLGVMARLGLPLTRGMEAFGFHLSKASERDLREVAARLENGLLVGDALGMPATAQYHTRSERALIATWRTPMISAAEAEVLRIGEMTGHLPEAAQLIGRERRRYYELRTWLYSAFAYPVCLLVMMLGVLSGIMVYIVPKFRKMFEELDVELPLMTRAVMGASQYLARQWAWIFLLVVALVVATAVIWRWRRAYLRADRDEARALRKAIFWLSYVHPNMRRAALAEFCRELAMLLRAGAPAPRALRVLATGTLNPWLRDRIERAAALTEQGVNLGAALDQARVDPRAAWFGYSLADRADVAEGLMRLADDYAGRVSWTSSIMMRLIPPVLIVIFGAVVGFIVIGVFMPLIKLMNSLGGS